MLYVVDHHDAPIEPDREFKRPCGEQLFVARESLGVPDNKVVGLAAFAESIVEPLGLIVVRDEYEDRYGLHNGDGVFFNDVATSVLALALMGAKRLSCDFDAIRVPLDLIAVEGRHPQVKCGGCWNRHITVTRESVTHETEIFWISILRSEKDLPEGWMSVLRWKVVRNESGTNLTPSAGEGY